MGKLDFSLPGQNEAVTHSPPAGVVSEEASKNRRFKYNPDFITLYENVQVSIIARTRKMSN